ncbi:MAG: MopE-related protein [Myxococcota bacterium]
MSSSPVFRALPGKSSALLCVLGFGLLAFGGACTPYDPADLYETPSAPPIPDADEDGYDAESDCDDTNNTVYPNAPELCDSLDNDCDADIDEFARALSYFDSDGDSFGDATKESESCPVPNGYVLNADDCNDADPAVSPGAPELCDGLDNNCNDLIDEQESKTVYRDADGDGFGDTGQSQESTTCEPPEGYILQDGDCDDSNPAINPDAVETCDRLDNDCSGTGDDRVALYPDADGDGIGARDSVSTSRGCGNETGFSAYALDCDDASAQLYPVVVDPSVAAAGLSLKNVVSKVQEGINATQTCGEVWVTPGTYTENVKISGKLRLQLAGVEGGASTTLVGPAGARALELTGNNELTVVGFSIRAEAAVAAPGGGILIQSCTATELSGLDFRDLIVTGDQSFGGAVAVIDSTEVTINSSYFEGNQAYQSGGVGVESANVSIRKSTFVGNKALYVLGGAGAQDLRAPTDVPAKLVVEDSLFVANIAEGYGGGALGAYPGQTVEVYRSTFEDNQMKAKADLDIGSGGGAIYNPSHVEQSIFMENVSDSYGGALLLVDNAYVGNNLFYANEGSLSGGAVTVFGTYSPDNYIVFTQNTLVDNVSLQGSSIYLYDADKLNVYNNIFYNNASGVTHVCIIETGGSVFVAEYNDFYATDPTLDSTLCLFGSEKDYDVGFNNLQVDPLFVLYSKNEALSELSLRLQEGSPARGAGKSTDGGTRPDLGAYGGADALP